MPKRELFLLLTITSLFTTLSLNAQNTNAKLKEAEAFHKSYEFSKAIEIYGKLIKEAQDTTAKGSTEDLSKLNKLLAQSQNGGNMLNFAYSPGIIAAKESSIKTFFLLYPGFDNGKWVLTPPEFTGESGERSYMFLPDNARRLVFSAKDNSGSWNIYTSSMKENGEWTYPEMLNENITSTGDELFPYITDDGKSLYFSSNGHYGMGGFDIYVSRWDENSNDWGVAQNLGFPFSSPEDDFLYYDTPDGNYTVFASTRDTRKDSVMVYALDFDNLPIKKRISPAEAREIAHLTPFVGKTVIANNEPKKDDNNGMADDGTTEYTEFRSVVTTVRSLRKQIKEAITSIDNNRNLFNTLTDETDLKTLALKISEQETAVLRMRDSLNRTSSRLQELEMEFLSKGIIIPGEAEEESAQTNTANENLPVNGSSFVFANNTLGETPVFNVEAAAPPAGIALKIEETTPMIYEFATIPEGLVYQYQLFVVSQQQNTERFGGITPVFERKASSGKYIYTAGIFGTYSGALSNVNKVKKSGFPNAMIVAYDSGKPLTLSAARAMEKRLKAEGKLLETNNETGRSATQTKGEKGGSATYRINITGYTESIGEEVLKVIRENTEKDIAKHVEGGVLVYSIGVFSDKAEADKLAVLLERAANGNSSIGTSAEGSAAEEVTKGETEETIEEATENSQELQNGQRGNKIIITVEKIDIKP